MDPEPGVEKKLLLAGEMTLSEQPPPLQGDTTKAELNPEAGAGPGGSEQELLLKAAHSPPPPKDAANRQPTVSKLRQMKEDLFSLLRGLNWEGLAIVTCLCLAYLLCSASYSIISPFFPEEVK